MDIHFTPLKIIEGTGGAVLHALKASSPDYVGFGEAYFSTVFYGETKNWRKHTRMTCNLIVPVGGVKFCVIDGSASKAAGKLVTKEFELSRSNYGRLTIPPGYWFNMQGMEPGLNLILNIADIEHDAGEMVTLQGGNISFQSFQF